MTRGLIALSLVLFSCTPEDTDGEELDLIPADDCDPLDEGNCIFPFPSSRFLAEDDSTETGWRVSYGPESLPLNRDGVQIDPTYWNEKDGFSINTHPMAFFEDLDDSTLNHWSTVDAFDASDATTLFVNVETGELVPHFAETDDQVREVNEVARPVLQSSLFFRPVVALDYDTTYVVAVRNVKKTDGSDVDVNPAFAALRDGGDSGYEDVEGRRQRYEDVVFPAIEAAGWSRDEVQLAWDFHTMSRMANVGRMEWMLEDALFKVGDGPAYAIDEFVDEDCAAGAKIGRTIYGTVDVPQYTETGKPGTVLTRDENGWPYDNGVKQAKWMIRIPCSVIEAGEPAPILQYGHGLLGGLSEARTGWLSDWANRAGYVVFAMDWTGMSENDRGDILLMTAGDMSDMAMIPERTMQGFIDKVYGLRMMHTSMLEDDLVRFPDVDGDGTPDEDANLILDPSRLYYHGNSQGGILGSAYVAVSPDLTRGAFGVGGGPYALLLNRSKDFDLYFDIMRQKFDDDRDIAVIVNGLMQALWDPGEGTGYAHHMKGDTLGDNPDKEVLIQVAIGDAQVTHLGARIHARSWDAKAVAPLPEGTPFLVEEATDDFTGSGYVEWKYTDVIDIPEGNTPPQGIDPHECPRRELEAQQQMETFFADGTIVNYCDGPCTALAEDCR